MKSKKWLICLFLSGFFVFSLNAVDDFWKRQPVSKNNLVQLVSDKPSYYDLFSKELLIVLAKITADERAFDAVCQADFIQEEIYQIGETEVVIIALYLLNDPGDKLLIWRVDASKLKNSKVMKAFAWEAAYVLLRCLSESEPKKELVITPPQKRML